MEEIFSKERLKEFISFKGEVRGTTLKAYGEFILKRRGGTAGVKKTPGRSSWSWVSNGLPKDESDELVSSGLSGDSHHEFLLKW